MRSRFFIFLGIGVLLIVFILFFANKKHKLAQNSPAQATNAIAMSPLPISSPPKQNTQNKYESAASELEAMIAANPDPKYAGYYLEQQKTDQYFDWKQPVNFYGRVVDESNVPVANASAHFQWTDLSENGTSEADVNSDGNGFFSLVNRTGKRMSVIVKKEDYYTPKSEFFSFEYANPFEGRFTPDKNNPIVFHLRKKGVGTDLITSQYGIRDDFPISVPPDGSPVKVDLMQRKSGSDGQMEISQIKPEYKNWLEVTNWSFKMEIPDGGFIEENDEFPFEAPTDGYQPSVEFDLKKDQPNWTPEVQKDYYIKFGNPSRYGHLHLETSLMLNGARLTYAINPDGSHYLEPK